MKFKKVKKHCRICKSQMQINYKDTDFLGSFLNKRGKLVPRSYTGNCAKHQRALTIAIKQARSLALVPYIAE